MVCARSPAEGCCSACTSGNCRQKQRGRGAQSGRGLVAAGCVAACVFFYAGLVSGRRGIVAIDRAAVPAQLGCGGWCDAGADVAGLAGARGGRSAKARSDGRNFLVGDALLYGQHLAARYGLGKHGALIGSARAFAGYAAGGICKRASRCGAPARWKSEGVAEGGDRGFAAAGDFDAEETDIYAALGRVAARPVAEADRGKFCGAGRGIGTVSSQRWSTPGVERVSCGEDFVVAAMVDLRFE